MLTTVLVANRGEIAARIIRTCAELGIRSVAVFSDADAKSLHVRLADDAVRLPGVTARETYLDADAIVAAATSSGADAVHPGYGFLSENASFAAAVGSAGLTFVGPSAEVIAMLGDKLSARALATAEGVPVIPGIDLGDGGEDRLRAFGDEHGWPVLIKPALGGGGVGMRVVGARDDVASAVEAARAEAGAAFGDRTVYAEHYLTGARHIEVQVMGDRHGRIVVLGDRDCSVQRRHQKLVEEAPTPGLDPGLREAMADAALRLARRVGYVGAGTVEFLLSGGSAPRVPPGKDRLSGGSAPRVPPGKDSGSAPRVPPGKDSGSAPHRDFYFLEMNTRIQVEHPVTEAVYGVDLVREQLLVAGGEPLSIGADLAPRGHAIECRINAEDPARGFLPAPGTLERLAVAWRPGVRLDSGYESGDEVPAHYDSLLAKLVVWGPTRQIVLHRLRGVLAETGIEGIASTLPALCAVAEHADFAAGGVSTHWFEKVLAPSLQQPAPVGSTPAEVAPEPETGVWIGGRFHRLPVAARDEMAGTARRPRTARSTPSRFAASDAVPAPEGGHQVRSPMRATVTAIAVTPGDVVAAGQVLGVVEAMKMEHPLTSPLPGRVVTVQATVGQLVSAGEVVLVVEPPPRADRPTDPEGAADAGN